MLTLDKLSRPKSPAIKRYARRISWSLASMGLILVLVFAFFGSPRLAGGLQYQVFAQDLEAVSALAFDGNGDMYATLEKRHGQGRLVHIRQGKTEEVLGGLDKPDGILLQGDTLYLTSESGPHALSILEMEAQRYLGGISGAEGIARAAAGKILVIEDQTQGGRLLRINPATGEIETLLDGLKQAEGVCETPGGEIYYVEKTSDRLWRYSEGRGVTAATGLAKPAFLNCLADGAILITEDRTNFGRLLRYRDGAIEVLARFLGAPQSVIVGPDGAYYLAEQRKNRILKINGN